MVINGRCLPFCALYNLLYLEIRLNTSSPIPHLIFVCLFLVCLLCSFVSFKLEQPPEINFCKDDTEWRKKGYSAVCYLTELLGILTEAEYRWISFKFEIFWNSSVNSPIELWSTLAPSLGITGLACIFRSLFQKVLHGATDIQKMWKYEKHIRVSVSKEYVRVWF